MLYALGEHSFLVFVGVVVVMGVIGVIFSNWSQDRAAVNLQKLAAQLGLEFVLTGSWKMATTEHAFGLMGSPGVTGLLRGRKIQIFNYTPSDTDMRTQRSVVTAQVATALPFTFILHKRDFSAKLSELAGVQEITIDHAKFNRAWFLESNQPELLRAILLPELCEKLMTVQKSGATGDFALTDGELKYAEIGNFFQMKRIERFAALVALVCDLADAVEAAALGRGKA